MLFIKVTLGEYTDSRFESRHKEPSQAQSHTCHHHQLPPLATHHNNCGSKKIADLSAFPAPCAHNPHNPGQPNFIPVYYLLYV